MGKKVLCKIFYVFGQKSVQNIWNWVEECAIFAPAFGRGHPGREGWRRRGEVGRKGRGEAGQERERGLACLSAVQKKV